MTLQPRFYPRGEFVSIYYGDLISEEDANEVERSLRMQLANGTKQPCYLFYFKWKRVKMW